MKKNTFRNIDDIALQNISEFTNRFPMYSEFNKVNIDIWNFDDQDGYCFVNKNLVMKFRNNDVYSYTFLGANKIDDTIRILLDQGLNLESIPDINFNGKIPKCMEENRDNFDYILDVPLIARLKGKKFKKKRWKIHKLHMKHDLNMVYLDISEPKVQEDILILLFNNYKDKTFHKVTELALLRLFADYGDDENIKCIGVCGHNNLMAVSINYVDGVNAIGLFAFMDKDIDSLGNLLTYETCKYLNNIGVKDLNIEQDLGIESLRDYKLSFSHTFLKKYRLKIV